jgi:hypothetical protein
MKLVFITTTPNVSVGTIFATDEYRTDTPQRYYPGILDSEYTYSLSSQQKQAALESENAERQDVAFRFTSESQSHNPFVFGSWFTLSITIQ